MSSQNIQNLSPADHQRSNVSSSSAAVTPTSSSFNNSSQDFISSTSTRSMTNTAATNSNNANDVPPAVPLLLTTLDSGISIITDGKSLYSTNTISPSQSYYPSSRRINDLLGVDINSNSPSSNSIMDMESGVGDIGVSRDGGSTSTTSADVSLSSTSNVGLNSRSTKVQHQPNKSSSLHDEETDRISLLEAEVKLLKESIQKNTLQQRPNRKKTIQDTFFDNVTTTTANTSSQLIQSNPSIYYGTFTKELEYDSYTFMICFKPFHSAIWWYGFIVCCFQFSLVLLIIFNLWGQSRGTTPFDVPFNVTFGVRVGQILALIVGVAMQKDITAATSHLFSLRRRRWRDEEVERSNYVDWTSVLIHPPPHEPKLLTWMSRILFPNLCKMIQGVLVLFTTFIIVIQSENTIELFKDFAAMQIISELDNMAFWLVENGYGGKVLAKQTKLVKRIRLPEDNLTHKCAAPIRFGVIASLFFAMVSGWAYIVHGQMSGEFFFLKYPNCPITDLERISLIGDGTCDGGIGNSVECKFDGGDCIDFNIGFPGCSALEPFRVGDGVCDEAYNVKECQYDGGDCCPVEGDEFLGDGQCHGGIYNTRACRYDNGDCASFRSQYPRCETDSIASLLKEEPHVLVILGDGICDGGAYRTAGECIVFNNRPFSLRFCAAFYRKLQSQPHESSFYNNTTETACGFEAGDCSECAHRVPNFALVGNGECNGGPYNTESCNFDGGDCIRFNSEYPSCNVPNPWKVGNGRCDGGIYYSEECGWDGGDCDECEAPNLFKIGDKVCDGKDYMSPKCGNDGGDCKNCKVNNPNLIGDGICQGDGRFNTTACGFDGGDCIS